MKLRVASLDRLADRTALKFGFERRGEPMSGLVAHHGGRVVAYRNRCRHMPWPLDWDDGKFYTRDGEYFICRTHGAVYEPLSGLCVLGPCQGDSLERLPVSIEDGEIWIETED